MTTDNAKRATQHIIDGVREFGPKGDPKAIAKALTVVATAALLDGLNDAGTAILELAARIYESPAATPSAKQTGCAK